MVGVDLSWILNAWRQGMAFQEEGTVWVQVKAHEWENPKKNVMTSSILANLQGRCQSKACMYKRIQFLNDLLSLSWQSYWNGEVEQTMERFRNPSPVSLKSSISLSVLLSVWNMKFISENPRDDSIDCPLNRIKIDSRHICESIELHSPQSSCRWSCRRKLNRREVKWTGCPWMGRFL